MTPPALTTDDCTRCGHSLSHHRYRDSEDDRPATCHFINTELGEVCDCPAYTPRVDPVPAGEVDFDEEEETKP